MDTPICDFVKKYADNRPIRAHMPADKGKKYPLDITEILGADSLFDANGIIAKSEENAANIFGSGYTLYSTEGSSLCIRTMVLTVVKYAARRGEKPLILATRNAHYSFVSAVALLDVDVEWLWGKKLLESKITADALRKKLEQMPQKPTAVYITSPDYLGNIAPISDIRAVCDEYGILLLVDNAHGAYLKFLQQDIHPITLGADMCADSAHKTLSVLTGGAYLHVGKRFEAFSKRDIKSFMKTFASTSPSYLILQSLDEQNAEIFDFKNKFSECAKNVKKLKERLIEAHFTLIGDEELKISVFAKGYGYSGLELCEILQKQNIFVEFCDPDFVVLMLSPQNSQKDFDSINLAMQSIKRRPPISGLEYNIKPKRVTSIKNALFGDSEQKPVDECLGKVMADPSVSCPPAVCVLVSGEIIDEESIKVLKYYGVTHCSVMKGN